MRFKIFIAGLLALFVTVVQAQSSSADTVAEPSAKFRAEAGYGQTYRHGDYIVKSPHHVVRIGANIEFPIKNGLGVETGLKYSYALGKREQLYQMGDTAFASYTGHWLDVPVRITYTLPIFWGMKLFGYAGPNFNIGLSLTEERNNGVRKENDPAPSYLPEPGTYSLYGTELNRMAIQLGAGGGIQWKNYRLRSGYDWGLNNVGKNKDRPERLRGWHVAFEYEF